MDVILMGLLGSLAAGLCTSIGAIPALLLKRVPQRVLDAGLGVSAGIMLAASSFSLLVPSLEKGGIVSTLIGFTAGAFLFEVVDRVIPHIHPILGYEGPPRPRLKGVWLMVLAITIHNFPEGLSVGVGYGTGDYAAATALAIGIGIQNIPEGLAVALPILGEEDYSGLKAFYYATISGLVEPVGGLLGVVLVSTFKPVLPYAMSFAAGAMIFVVSDEMIPESHRKGHEKTATVGTLMGFLIMMFLDNLLS